MSSIQTSGDPYAIAKVLKKGKLVHRDSKDVAKNWQGGLRDTLSNQGLGQMYTVNFFTTTGGVVVPYGVRSPHRASAPGDPPAPDTGALRNSIDYLTQKLVSGSEVTVGSDVDQAVYTEYGTSKMRKRPWFRKTTSKIKLKMIKPWEKGIERRERAEARRLGGSG